MRFDGLPRSAVEQELRSSGQWRQQMAQAAQTVAGSVRDQAPTHTYAYRNSIQASENVVLSDDPAAHLIEWGSRTNPAYAPIRRGALAAGAHFGASSIAKGI